MEADNLARLIAKGSITPKVDESNIVSPNLFEL
jgi:hypothetical protein